MPYKVKGKCIYKKKSDGSLGKKVGCTKGSVDKYLSALHANVNESQDFDWAEDIPSEVDFDTWSLVADIIDEETSQGPAYHRWVGSESYNNLKSVLNDYGLDIDDMGDFFQYPPQDRFGNYFTTYKINELKDDLNQNGFGDPEDIFESNITEGEFDWVGDIESLDERGFYVGDEFIDTDDVEPIKYTIKNIVNNKVLLTWFSPYDNQDVEYVDNLSRLESRLEDGFIKFTNELNENFDWISDIKAGETLGNIKLNNFEGYNVGDKITVTGGVFVEDYDGERDNWIWLNQEPFMINDIIPNLGRFVLLALNEKFINNPESKHFLLNDSNELYIGDYRQDNDLLISTTHTENLKESGGFDWVDDIQPETEWDKEKYYVLDVRSLSGVQLRETIDDIWDFAYNMDYDVEVGVQYDTVGYIYFEPNDEVPEGYALDWSPRETKDPTFGGKYQMLSLEEFYHMAYGEEPLNESNDFDWVGGIKPGLTPGQKYYVKTPSGIWTGVEYCGRGDTEHPDTGELISGHRFRDINRNSGGCNEWWSESSLQSKIDDNLIKEYDPNWSILDDIEFGALEDIKGRNFAIYFDNGVDIEQTTKLQKTLFDMGYAFPNRKDEFKPVTNEDTNNRKIIFFECFNWDTSIPRYNRMPPNMRDEGTMLMVADNPDDYFRDDKETQRQIRLSEVIDHNAIVVDGYNYLD